MKGKSLTFPTDTRKQILNKSYCLQETPVTLNIQLMSYTSFYEQYQNLSLTQFLSLALLLTLMAQVAFWIRMSSLLPDRWSSFSTMRRVTAAVETNGSNADFSWLLSHWKSREYFVFFLWSIYHHNVDGAISFVLLVLHFRSLTKHRKTIIM